MMNGSVPVSVFSSSVWVRLGLTGAAFTGATMSDTDMTASYCGPDCGDVTLGRVLTRMFTLEYTLWFDFFLPALEKLRIPIPLGGTSNHFRTATLRDLNAWDPYNVTEDADLGLRLARFGWRVEDLRSTTWEEAPNGLSAWMNQRTRWMKGTLARTKFMLPAMGSIITQAISSPWAAKACSSCSMSL